MKTWEQENDYIIESLLEIMHSLICPLYPRHNITLKVKHKYLETNEIISYCSSTMVVKPVSFFS